MKPPASKIPLRGSERTPLPGFHAVRRVRPDSIIHVTVLLRPAPKDQGLRSLEEMAARLPQERHYLSREEYATAHGPHSADVDKVLRFTTAHGLKLDGIDRPARMVHLRGTAAAIRKAFNVDLFVYERVGPRLIQRYRGRAGPVYIPAELEGIVQAVMGLDDRPQARSALGGRGRQGPG